MTDQTSTAAAGRLFARTVLVRRLVEHHAVAPDEALAAVLAAERHEVGPHTELVHAEAAAIAAALIEPIMRSLRQAADAILPTFKAATNALAQLAAVTRDQYALAPLPDRRRRDRPAWQSPYGPPVRHHR